MLILSTLGMLSLTNTEPVTYVAPLPTTGLRAPKPVAVDPEILCSLPPLLEPASTLPVAKAPFDEPESPQKTEALVSSDDEASTPTGACPDEMVEVKGDYCPAVEHTCTKYIGDRSHDRCAEYAPESRCIGKPAQLHFCIDRYEYPNQPGQKPMVALNWEDARQACELQGKRLCTDTEWTLACEGSEHTPYPYGYERDSEACNIDRPYIMPRNGLMANPDTRAAELERLDQRVPSGQQTACVSPYGVYDMTGNVDEWVNNTAGRKQKAPFDSGLKGGYWGPVRNRCRPMTTDHNRWHYGYQIGFRCCAGPNSIQQPSADETPETDATEAAELPGSGEQSALGRGEQSAPGSGEQSALGRGEQSALGRGEQSALGRGEQSALGPECDSLAEANAQACLVYNRADLPAASVLPPELRVAKLADESSP